MVNIKEDLSTLTTIEKSVFMKLEQKIEWCICDAIEKALLNKDDTVDVNLGFGQLTIKLLDDEIKYRFKPSQKFEKSIFNTIVNEQNDLTYNLESSLVSKLNNIYKTLL